MFCLLPVKSEFDELHDLMRNVDLNNIRLSNNHNDFILIEYAAISIKEHEFVISIVAEYLRKYTQCTDKNIFTKTKYTINAERVTKLTLHEFFHICYKSEIVRNGSNDRFSINIENDKFEKNYLVPLDKSYSKNFINVCKNIFFIDNCINQPGDFALIMAELNIYFPKEIKKNQNYIILLLEFDDLNSRKLWNEQKFDTFFEKAQASNLKYFSFDSFELGTSYISNSNENYVYTFDNFVFDKTTECNNIETRQILQPLSINNFIRKNNLKEIFMEVINILNKTESFNDNFKIVPKNENENNFKILGTLKFLGMNISIEAILGYEEEIDDEKLKKKKIL
ncbi:hypothetical protein GVAV_002011 [Gurleya vavrai]